jgi:hypothetical protein
MKSKYRFSIGADFIIRQSLNIGPVLLYFLALRSSKNLILVYDMCQFDFSFHLFPLSSRKSLSPFFSHI